MPRKAIIKTNHRFVMYIPDMLRKEVERWTNKMGMTFAEFGREAFELYLEKKRKEEREAQLAETCRLFKSQNTTLLNDWGIEPERRAA
ncbi:MAG: hypothetical protein ACE5G1_17530 [bacterium]